MEVNDFSDDMTHGMGIMSDSGGTVVPIVFAPGASPYSATSGGAPMSCPGCGSPQHVQRGSSSAHAPVARHDLSVQRLSEDDIGRIVGRDSTLLRRFHDTPRSKFDAARLDTDRQPWLATTILAG
ncbi:MAG: hypothetical protein ACYDFS_11810 [Vulcanimicrobiaceae bacterium]